MPCPCFRPSAYENAVTGVFPPKNRLTQLIWRRQKALADGAEPVRERLGVGALLGRLQRACGRHAHTAPDNGRPRPKRRCSDASTATAGADAHAASDAVRARACDSNKAPSARGSVASTMAQAPAQCPARRHLWPCSSIVISPRLISVTAAAPVLLLAHSTSERTQAHFRRS